MGFAGLILWVLAALLWWLGVAGLRCFWYKGFRADLVLGFGTLLRP